MYNLNKKQKIILVTIGSIVTIVIFYYAYAKDNKEKMQLNNFNIENEIKQDEIEENIEEKSETENSNEDIILVHVSGAVNKEGVVELKINSRISDAIEKARRNKRKCIYKRIKFSI